MKQAPHAWFQYLLEFLLACGFSNSSANASLFVWSRNHKVVYILIYVGDFIVTSTDGANLMDAIRKICKTFKSWDLGHLSYFLGLEMHILHNKIVIAQKKYVLDLLRRFGMSDCKSISTPIAPGQQLSLTAEQTLIDPILYRSLVGAL